MTPEYPRQAMIASLNRAHASGQELRLAHREPRNVNKC